MWRWPDDSPLHAQVARKPPLLNVLPAKVNPHQAPPSTGNHLLVLVEAGIILIGLAQEDTVEPLHRHRRYMTRKSQGRAQLWHKPKGGRLSYGARLRHRESRAFFKESIEALEMSLQSAGIIHHSWWHCDPRLKGELRLESPKLLDKIERHSSKLPGPTDIYGENPIELAWRRITFGNFKGPDAL